MIRSFSFNGTSSSGKLFVNQVRRSMTPPRTLYTRDIPKKHGSIYQGLKFGTRFIEVTVSFVSVNDLELWTEINELNKWLFTEEPKELYFNDEPDRIYKAILTGDTDLDQLASMGSVTLTFACHDPFKYRTWEKTALTNEQTTAFENEGNFKAYPRFRIFPYVDMTDFTITLQETGERITLSGRTFPASVPIIIDNNSNYVYFEETNENLMPYVHIDSEFFSFASGLNTITNDKTPDIYVTRVFLLERWL